MSKKLNLLALIVLLLGLAAFAPPGQGPVPTRFRAIYVDHDATVGEDLTVTGDLTVDDVTIGDDLAITGDLDVTGAVTLNSTLDVDGNITSGTGAITMTDTVNVGTDGTGYDVQLFSATAGDHFLWDASEETLTLTGTDGQDALNIPDGNLDADDDSAFGDAAGDTTTVTGDMAIAGLRDGATGYDYWLNISGGQTGLVDGAKTYGINITMDRTASYTQTGGDIDDAAIKARIGNYAANDNYTTVVRGLDVQARNRSTGQQGTVSGGQISIQTDSGGTTANGVALEVNATVNGAITDTTRVADFRLFRQAATEATNERIVTVRNSSTTGDGADAGMYITSDYGSSATTDSMDYGLDMSTAAINTADIRLENGETIDNGTDGLIDLSGDLQYGANDLYALGYASSGYEWECGTTATFTATTTIVATNLTTVTVPIVTQVTAPAATAAYLTATDPTTAAVTIASYGSDYNAGTTGVVVHYCFLGQD